MSAPIAVVTDIHANVLALEAPLGRIEMLRVTIERIYWGGDLVDYGPQPNEVCVRSPSLGIPTIYA